MSDPRNPRSHKDNRRGLDGEDYVARRDDLEACDGDDWCDLINPRTGSKHEVKVCRPGKRFRLWQDNHRSLTTSHGQRAAWYHFLVVTQDGTVVRERRMKPPTVTDLVQLRGGWNEAGHERGSQQHKLPETDVF